MSLTNDKPIGATPLAVRADLSVRAVVTPQHFHWVDSPVTGVKRMMLDRLGNEIARATSLVRYAPDSTFPNHVHGGGEEILVLEGVFADEYGTYPAGTYLRNPIGSSHAPSAGNEGATLFVKLHQFNPEDQEPVCCQSLSGDWQPGLSEGLSVLPLHEFAGEHVALVKWAPYTQFNPHQHWGGEEILVLQGTFYDEHGRYPQGSWLRNPHLSQHAPYTKDDGALIYVKTGHLQGNA